MREFKDNQDRTWPLQITIGSAKRVRDLLGVDILAPEQGEPPLLVRLGTDEILLCDVLYCLIKPQADEKGVSDEAFGEALGGEAITQAVEALYAELVDFFRSRGRTDRAAALQKQGKVIHLATERITTEISNLDIEAELDQVFGKASIGSQESSESPLTA